MVGEEPVVEEWVEKKVSFRDLETWCCAVARFGVFELIWQVQSW